jgi:D-aspartate ligase
LLQRYHAEAIDKIYSLSGFRDISGAHVIMRAAHKVLQRPRRLGVGLCFEEADVIADLAERTVLLCERIGYYGAFELEFIVSGGQSLLIDFNGRFYNQLAFDIARGMDLPRLVYAGSTLEGKELGPLIAAVQRRDKGQGLLFCDRFGLSLTLATHRAFGKMTSEEAALWRQWRTECGGNIVDAVRDSDDPVPALIDAAQQVMRSIRHPRAYLRHMASTNTGVFWTTAMAASGPQRRSARVDRSVNQVVICSASVAYRDVGVGGEG